MSIHWGKVPLRHLTSKGSLWSKITYTGKCYMLGNDPLIHWENYLKDFPTMFILHIELLKIFSKDDSKYIRSCRSSKNSHCFTKYCTQRRKTPWMLILLSDRTCLHIQVVKRSTLGNDASEKLEWASWNWS